LSQRGEKQHQTPERLPSTRGKEDLAKESHRNQEQPQLSSRSHQSQRQESARNESSKNAPKESQKSERSFKASKAVPHNTEKEITDEKQILDLVQGAKIASLNLVEALVDEDRNSQSNQPSARSQPKSSRAETRNSVEGKKPSDDLSNEKIEKNYSLLPPEVE